MRHGDLFALPSFDFCLEVLNESFTAMLFDGFARCGIALRRRRPDAASGTVSGTVLDARQAPIGDAAVDASGAGEHVSAVSNADGTFTLTLAPGIYDITVRKGGFQSAEDAAVTVTAGNQTPLHVALVEASISNLRVIGSTSSRYVASSSITPVSSISNATLTDRQVSSLQDVLPEVPGVTFGARGDTTDPYQYFTVRGASIETRVQLDGHPVNTGYGGRWDLSQVDPDVFGSVDVFKGAVSTVQTQANRSLERSICARATSRRTTCMRPGSASTNTARSSHRSSQAETCLTDA